MYSLVSQCICLFNLHEKADGVVCLSYLSAAAALLVDDDPQTSKHSNRKAFFFFHGNNRALFLSSLPSGHKHCVSVFSTQPSVGRKLFFFTPPVQFLQSFIALVPRLAVTLAGSDPSPGMRTGTCSAANSSSRSSGEQQRACRSLIDLTAQPDRPPELLAPRALPRTQTRLSWTMVVCRSSTHARICLSLGMRSKASSG